MMFERDRQITQRWYAVATIVLSVLAILLILQFILFSLVYQAIPNHFYSPFWATLSIYLDSSSGIYDALLVLIKEPLLIYEVMDKVTDTPVWSVYFFAWQALFFIIIYGLTIYSWADINNPSGRSVPWKIIFLLFVLLMLLTDMQNIECCGAGPAWLLEVWVRTRVFSGANSGLIDWVSVYSRVYHFSTPMRFILISLAAFYLVVTIRQYRRAGYDDI